MLESHKLVPILPINSHYLHLGQKTTLDKLGSKCMQSIGYIYLLNITKVNNQSNKWSYFSLKKKHLSCNPSRKTWHQHPLSARMMGVDERLTNLSINNEYVCLRLHGIPNNVQHIWKSRSIVFTISWEYAYGSIRKQVNLCSLPVISADR